VDMDPGKQFLVTNSREPALARTKTAAGQPNSPSAEEKVGQELPALQDFVVRILRRDSGKVLLVSRTRSAVHLPINSDGYLESLRGRGTEWTLNLNYFAGGSAVLGRVDSACTPSLEFIAQQEVLVTACSEAGTQGLVAMTTSGRHLWRVLNPSTLVWPLQTMALNGTRLVRETLVVTHSIDAYSPMEAEDVKGQLVTVQDAADGKQVLTAEASPVFDAGGNVAISPSGKRVAVLGAGAVQIFNLPEASPLPDGAETHGGH